MIVVAEALRLDLGCGSKVAAGFAGVDVASIEGVNRIDLLTLPWPWDDGIVDEVRCSHFFEHVPGKLRGVWMDELWRVMKVGAIATFIVPAWNSPGAVQDY